MNDKERPIPQTNAISIFDILNMRVGLEQIKEPSADIIAAIEKLDSEIAHFTSGLRH
jgi:hypothetical protein